MNNIISYLKNYHFTMEEKPFNVVDSLILCQFSYIKLNCILGSFQNPYSETTFRELLRAEDFNTMFKNIPASASTKELLFALSASPRFRYIKIKYHLDILNCACETQFSATTFILNNKLAYIAYRGTDYSIAGWNEDFNMAFIYPVPAQKKGLSYLDTIASKIPHTLFVGGHSKGGNIAVYSSMNCKSSLQNRIRNVFSHDGPGFTFNNIDATKFKLIEGKLIKTLPQASLFGMLLESPEKYKVVKSYNIGGLHQHDPFSWEVKDCDFTYLNGISKIASTSNAKLNYWISKLDHNKRKVFIDTLFSVINSTKCDNFVDLIDNWAINIPIMLDALNNIDEEIKDLIIDVLKEFGLVQINGITPKQKFNIHKLKDSLYTLFHPKKPL